MDYLIGQYPVIYRKLTELGLNELFDLNILAFLNAEEFKTELEKHLIFINPCKECKYLLALLEYSLDEKLNQLVA